MSTTPASVLKKLKNSAIQMIDGNSDAVNECMRRHLRKLEKTTRLKSKRNNANVAARPTKLAFVIYFDNGAKETNCTPDTNRLTTPITSEHAVGVNGLRLPPRPPRRTPSPVLQPPPPTATPSAPPTPHVVPPPTTTTPFILSGVLSSPVTPSPIAPMTSPPPQVIVPSAPPTVQVPVRPDDVLNLTRTVQDLSVANFIPVSAPTDVRICSITQETEPAWLITMRRDHRAALVPTEVELQGLNRCLEKSETGIQTMKDAIKSANDEEQQFLGNQKWLEDEDKRLDERKRVVDEEKKVVKSHLAAVALEKRESEATKTAYETHSVQTRVKINQTEALHTQVNQYWIDLINERLRQHRMHRQRPDVLRNKMAVKRLGNGGHQ